MEGNATDDIDAIASLAEPTRRALYEWVARTGRAVGRDEAAGALSIARPLAAHHLDRLVEVGLLVTEYRRLTGRTGPGAGRPAKLYRRVERDTAVSVPARRYDVAARLLAEAAEASDADRGTALAAAARRYGRALARALADGPDEPPSDLARMVPSVLESVGYAPRPGDDAAIRLRNCPFDALVADHRDLVCGMNLALVEGAIEGTGLLARLDPRPGFCCVAISEPAASSGEG